MSVLLIQDFLVVQDVNTIGTSLIFFINMSCKTILLIYNILFCCTFQKSQRRKLNLYFFDYLLVLSLAPSPFQELKVGKANRLGVAEQNIIFESVK